MGRQTQSSSLRNVSKPRGLKKVAPQMQIPIGIGLSQDIDSNMAVRNMLWCHGGSIQDKDGNVVLNSPETLRALEYAKKLYYVGMTQAVKQWAASVCEGRIVSCLEGGYNLNTLGQTVRAHVRALDSDAD